MPAEIQLVVGLGNPGSEYAKTRHNVGFWLLDELANNHSTHFQKQSKFFGETAQIRLADQQTWLLKPSTFMNRSGQSVATITRFYRIPVENILVVHDELDLEAGVIRLKQAGGHGGHNGLRDIHNQLNSNHYARLRVGIGHPGKGADVSQYVLNRPTATEEMEIQNALARSLETMPDIISGNLQTAMNQLHTKQE